MKALKTNQFLLNTFSMFNKQQQREIKKHLDGEQCKYILNVLKQACAVKTKVDEKIKKKLRKHQNKINKLLEQKVPFAEKKKILVNASFFASLMEFLSSLKNLQKLDMELEYDKLMLTSQVKKKKISLNKDEQESVDKIKEKIQFGDHVDV